RRESVGIAHVRRDTAGDQARQLADVSFARACNHSGDLLGSRPHGGRAWSFRGPRRATLTIGPFGRAGARAPVRGSGLAAYGLGPGSRTGRRSEVDQLIAVRRSPANQSAEVPISVAPK